MNQYITEEGLKKLKEEMESLKKKREEISKRIEEAKSLGDLSENAEYLSAREAQSFNEGRILEIEDILKNAIMIKKSHTDQSDIVRVGSRIEVSSDKNGRQVFIIVGSQEANPKEGKISNESPLGKALLGNKKGAVVEFRTPSGVVKYKILSIE